MLLEYLYLRVVPLLFDLEALVVLYFDLGSLALDFLNQFLELSIDNLDIFDSSELHLPEHLLAAINEVECALSVDLELPDDLLTIFLKDVDTFLLFDETVPTVIHNAVHAYEPPTSVAKVLH